MQLDARNAPSLASSQEQAAVAVVIPTYRRPEYLTNLVASLGHSDMAPDEIIVVDNDPDRSASLARLPESITRLSGGFGYSLAAARNLGWQAASSNLLFFVDDDNIVDPKTVRFLAEVLNSNPSLALAAPVVWDAERRSVWCAGIERSRWTGRTTFLWRGAVTLPRGGGWPTDDMPDAFMIRRSALASVGGFDERLFPIHYDEADLCERLRRNGWGLQVVADAVVQHLGFTGTRPGEEFTRAYVLHGRVRVHLMARSRVFFHRKHSRGAARHTTLCASVPMWLVLSVFSTLRSTHESLKVRLATAAALVRGALDGYRRPLS